MPNKGNVENLSKEGLLGQVDDVKATEAALKDWQRLAQRRAALEKEIAKDDGKIRDGMFSPIKAAFIPQWLQKKAQDEESLKSVLAEQQAMAGQYGMEGQDFGQVAAMLAKRSQDARTALDKSMALIKGTGLLGDLRGKSGDAVYLEYARVLDVAQSVIKNGAKDIEAALKESVAAQDSVDQAGVRLRDLLALHGAQRAAEAQVSAETARPTPSRTTSNMRQHWPTA